MLPILCGWPLETTAAFSDSPLLSKDKSDVIAFSPDGQWLATASTNGTTVYLYKLDDLDTPPFPLPGATTGEHAIGFSPDGRLLATGGRDGVVRLWSLASLSKPERSPITAQELPQRTGEVWALAFGVIDGVIGNGRR